jgi:hypothetical protein
MLVLLAALVLSCEEGEVPAPPGGSQSSSSSVGGIIVILAVAIGVGLVVMCIKCCCCEQKPTFAALSEEEQEEIPISTNIYGVPAQSSFAGQPGIVVSVLPDSADWDTRDAVPKHTMCATPAQV